MQVWYKFPFSEQVNYLNAEPQKEHEQNAFVIQGFDQKEPIYLSLKNAQAINLVKFKIDDHPSFQLSKLQHNYEADFENLVAQGVASIAEGRMEKVVLARQKVVACTKNPLLVFKELCEKYPNCFTHLIYSANEVCSIGASPELLLSTCNKMVKSVSMAGTLINGVGEFTYKEKEEQAFVTQYITAQFESLGIQPKIKDALIQNSNVQHLYSAIESNNNVSLQKGVQLLNLLHPTPAVCGFPFVPSKNFIDANEGFDRAWYSGFFGEIRASGVHTYVNLRCARLHEKKALLYAGAGITKDSNPNAEFLETEAKMEVLSTLL